jgi:hypothetical protein
MVHAGRVVRRFSWPDVLGRPEEVRDVLVDVVRQLRRRTA